MKFLTLFFAWLVVLPLLAQDDALVSHISFDNNNFEEVSGNGQNGIFSNTSPSFTCGVRGQALVMNGISDNLTLFGLGNVFTRNDFTVSFYIKPENTLSSQVLFSQRELCTNQNAMGINYLPSQRGLEVLFSENSSKSLRFNEPLDPSSCWYHVVFVREEADAYLYINNVQVWTGNSVTRIDLTNNAEVVFGGGPCLSPALIPYKGLLDEIEIFDRALNQREIASLYIQPNRILNARDTLVFLGTSIDIETNPTCATAFEWMPTTGVDDMNSPMPTITPIETTVYTAMFDEGNCTASDSILVKVVDPADLECDEIFLPSAFTPNGDGRNDTYGLSNPFAIESLISFEIFDQWGGRVFYTEDPFGQWDGYSKGEPLNPSVLLYRVHYRCGGEEYTQTGSVTVLR